MTGRPHQIRGQLAAEGYPIVGDKLYHRLQDKNELHTPQSRHWRQQRRRLFWQPKGGGVTSIGWTQAAGAIAGRKSWGTDPHAATRSPGNYVDSPRLALQAYDLRLEVEGRLHGACLPANTCWWGQKGRKE